MAEEVLIERVSQYGFMVGGAWVNVDKKAGVDPKAFHAGDAVTLEKNPAGFITSVILKTSAPPKKAFIPGKPSYEPRKQDPETSNKMARGAAVKVVFSSQFVYDHVKDMAEGEGLKRMLALSSEVANYIETGE